MKTRASPANTGGTRPAAIEDVAGAAGVSIATVSRLLNKPNLVAPETAAKVYRAIERLGYRPNPFAQGLMTRRSQLVGILLPDIHGEFYSELLRGADAEANKRGYHLLVASEANLQAGDAAGGALAPVFRLIDGLALMITEPNPALWSRVQRSGLPVVVLDTDPHEPGVHSIVVDNAAGAVEATRHLLGSVPATRCYFVGGPRGNFDTVQRGDAFSRTLRESGHKARKDQVVFGEYSFEWGQTWARGALPQLGREPIGVLAGNDEIAYGVLRTFADAGCPAPERLRIVGFDDTRLASLLRPTLSTVRVPMAEIGAAAIAALIDRIEDRDGHAACASIPTRLIVRESSRG